MSREDYQEELGGLHRDVPESYRDSIGHSCPTCRAEMGQLCINPINGHRKRMPCKARIPGC